MKYNDILNLNIYIDNNKVIRYNFNESDLFLIRV